MPSIFNTEELNSLLTRMNQLQATTQPVWGKLDAAKMLAHCCVAYEQALEGKGEKAKGLKKILLTWLVKPIVVSDKPYKKNSRTAPEFLVADARQFETEKERLSHYLIQTANLGEKHFDGKESNSFGKLSALEWNQLFWKHLDHHLRQFGV